MLGTDDGVPKEFIVQFATVDQAAQVAANFPFSKLIKLVWERDRHLVVMPRKHVGVVALCSRLPLNDFDLWLRKAVEVVDNNRGAKRD